ncbi:MAG: hypothetical protein KDA75_20665, partial [Planctomycetaceae bacterium]|nr:hypothetical protein [Planctomycetaceae bacterium]
HVVSHPLYRTDCVGFCSDLSSRPRPDTLYRIAPRGSIVGGSSLPGHDPGRKSYTASRAWYARGLIAGHGGDYDCGQYTAPIDSNVVLTTSLDRPKCGFR